MVEGVLKQKMHSGFSSIDEKVTGIITSVIKLKLEQLIASKAKIQMQ
jgi:hypothetical protein